jgi:hypothetical protein
LLALAPQSPMCTTRMNQALGEHEDFFIIRSEDSPKV